MLKKVLLFAGNQFYPNGGWEDFVEYFDSIDEAKKFLIDNFNDESYMWAHIVLRDRIKVSARRDTNNDGFIFEWKFSNQMENEPS